MKAWKQKEGANTKRNYCNKCNDTKCKYYERTEYRSCLMHLNFRTCPHYNVPSWTGGNKRNKP